MQRHVFLRPFVLAGLASMMVLALFPAVAVGAEFRSFATTGCGDDTVDDTVEVLVYFERWPAEEEIVVRVETDYGNDQYTLAPGDSGARLSMITTEEGAIMPGTARLLIDGEQRAEHAYDGRVCAPFVDVPEGSIFFDDVDYLVGAQITLGCNPPRMDRFCPSGHVSRAEMAAFLVRALALTEMSPSGNFSDVPSDSPFADDINKVATAGISKGCNPPDNDRYCPSDEVSRAEMAAFLARGLGLTETSPSGEFTDVPADSPFATEINQVATADVSRGCNPPANDRFCPSDAVTRAQMAAFLHRAQSDG